MSAVGPAHRAQEQDHASRTAHNSPTEIGSIRCHLTRGSLFIPLGLSGPLAQTPESNSAPSAPGPASGAAYGSSPGGKLGHRPPRLIPHFSSPAPVALAGLLATLPQPNVLLLLLLLARSLPPALLSSNAYGDCSCPRFRPGPPRATNHGFCSLSADQKQLRDACHMQPPTSSCSFLLSATGPSSSSSVYRQSGRAGARV